MQNSHQIKSAGITLLVSALVFCALYFTPIKNTEKIPTTQPREKQMNTDSLLSIQDTIQPTQVELPETVPAPVPSVNEEQKAKENPPKKDSVKADKKPEETLTAKEKKLTEQKKLAAEKKLAEDKKLAEEKAKKEADNKIGKVGVDRKLIAGIPGTLNYKGKLPSLKTKGTITIGYTVDKNGTVISAHRVGGISDKTAINNAIMLVKKHVKVDKGTSNATGTYSITF